MKKIVTQFPIHKIPNHKCVLSIEDDPIDLRIYQGICVPFRRLLWQWVTVSESNPESKRFLKSAAQIASERIRHIDYYPCVIHPFSEARYCWEMVMILVWLILFTVIPVTVAKIKVPLFLLYVEEPLLIICGIDIILWFFTGYYDIDHQMVVLQFKKIVWRYVRSYFIFDVLSSLPVNFYLNVHDPKGRYHFLCTILFLKAIRLPTLKKYIQKFSERTNFLTSHVKFLCFVLTLLILVSWTSSAVYMTVELLFPAQLYRHTTREGIPGVMTAYRVTRALMKVGVTDNVNTSKTVMLFQIFCITVGTVLEIIILAKVLQVYKKRSNSRNKYNSLLQQIGEYMKYKELPSRLRAKILKYIDFKFQKRIFRDKDVLDNLSSVLKHDILLHTCQHMVSMVDFFKDLPPNVIMRIVVKLRSEIYLPNDVIILEGYTGNAMYFIYIGTVAVYTGYGKEICHLEDGNHFGEIALLINEPRVATVIAIKECELFKLSRRDFQEAIEPFPELYKKIRTLAMRRLESTLQLTFDEEFEHYNVE